MKTEENILIYSPFDILPGFQKYFHSYRKESNISLSIIKEVDPLWENSPAILLPWQQELIKDNSRVQIWEKSRRIGISWADACDSVLKASQSSPGGMDCYYIGYNHSMAEQYIKDCAFWARSFNLFTSQVDQYVFEESEDKSILAFRIKFSSGFSIIALSSKPENLRAKKGKITIDEAAFHPDFPGLLKAGLAILMWGGFMHIISTHNGVGHAFNQLIEETIKGENDFSLHRCDFKTAIAQGLYKRICLIQGLEWSQDLEDAWVKQIYKDYGTGAKEELDCIPISSEDSLFDPIEIENCSIGEWEKPYRNRFYLGCTDPNFGGSDFYDTQIWDITEFPGISLVAEYRKNYVSVTSSIKESLRLFEAYKPHLIAVESNSGGVIIAEKYIEECKNKVTLKKSVIETTMTTKPSKIVNTDRIAQLISWNQCRYPSDWVGKQEMQKFSRVKREALVGNDDTVTCFAAGMSWLNEALENKPRASKPLVGKSKIIGV